MKPTKLPAQTGPIHFIGAGGIGMSGIAETLLNHGYVVQGSDLKMSTITRRLEGLGATIFEEPNRHNVRGSGVVVISSAIQADNCELMEARHLRIPVVRRAEMLAELMRLKSNIAVAGTHGKTTTTTIVAALLESGGFDPTVINGGIIHAYGSNARLGAGEWMVVEADESDGTFIKLPATVAVVTSIDPEHLDHFGSFDELREAFHAFVSNIPFYGYAVCCLDHPEVRALAGRITDRRIISYGLAADADVSAGCMTYTGGTSQFTAYLRNEDTMIEGCELPMPGVYNVTNALAAIAVARSLGVAHDVIRNSLRNFTGVNRRFTRVGDVQGVQIIDDYAHHPVEIAAAVRAARQTVSGRLVVVHQPHRYTRLESLFDQFSTCFDGADRVAIADVYAAGEDPIKGADRDALVEALNRKRRCFASGISGPEEMAEFVSRDLLAGDMVLCLGAGSISAWAHDLPRQLNARAGNFSDG
ncbi:MAG: UDP-N-acetylmuramate--L-alanine ligase [Rhodobacteraceae bacterium]|nr:UDP-N-acetylmuramate--L-alanine ligase [Paracoccaceae bacterium]MCY4197595.1 UDP-N-acetylmuramate--L-alanine ligase [Paracoccaceae bacterium]